MLNLTYNSFIELRKERNMTTVTKLILGSPVVQEAQPVNTYQLVVSFMHGDADHYTEETYMFSLAEEEALIKGINFFNSCMSAYPHGRGGYDTYEKLGLPDWEEWEDKMPNDITSEGFSATVDSIKVFFWTADSEQYEVILKDG
jgi:hypothetical protein